MKSAPSSKLTLAICALVGGVFISSASAKPFKLFSHDHDRDRDEDREAKVYIITDEAAPAGQEGTVRIVPPGTRVIVPAPPEGKVVPAPEANSAPATQTKSRKSRTGDTKFLVPEPAEMPAEVRKAEAVEEDTHERVTTTEKKAAPVKTSRSSTSRKESAQTTKKRVQHSERNDEEEAKPEVSVTRHKEEEAKPEVTVTRKKEREVEPAAPKREVVEESTASSVVRANDNPLAPNPAATEERKPLVPAEPPVPREKTTVTKEVTTSRTPGIQEAPPEQHIQRQVDENVSSTPTPEVPTLTAPSDYASSSARPRDDASSVVEPKDLPAVSKHTSADIPAAEKTDKPGFVKTPFTPSKLIDVRGMASGSLAKDPSTNKVFRVP